MSEFRQAIDLLPEPILLIDHRTLEIVVANRRARRHLGLVPGPSWLVRMHDEESLRTLVCAGASVRDLLPGHVKLVDDAGEVVSYRCGVGRAEHDGRALVLVRIGPSALDERLDELNAELMEVRTTLARRQQEQVIERQMLETQKLESLGVLAGGIAHDFNNLLAAVLGNVSLARVEIDQGHQAQPYLADAELASRRAAELCSQLLAYSGRGRFVLQPVDMTELVEEMTHLLRVSVSKRTGFRTALTPGLPTIEGDATQLRQVVMNVITNASDALEDSDGEVTLTTTSREATRAWLDAFDSGSALPEGTYVIIEVSDTGCGMTRDTIERMFEPFFSTKFAGRGLGLAAARGIVRSHRGGLRVTSEVGHGTTIRVALPALLAPATATPPPVPQTAHKAERGLILVADDEELIRTIAKRVLERRGYQVVVAVDGEQALEAFAQHQHDIVCVVLDLTMPKRSGDEVFQEIRAKAPNTPIVLSSGYAKQESAHRFASHTAFLQKPWTPRELIDVLNEVAQPQAPPTP